MDMRTTTTMHKANDHVTALTADGTGFVVWTTDVAQTIDDVGRVKTFGALIEARDAWVAMSGRDDAGDMFDEVCSHVDSIR
jgi:hypothetical protein